MQLFLIHLFCCLVWLCNIALAQFEIDQNVTGSASISSDIEISFVGNLAIFVTSLLRGRLDLEMGARDLLATLRSPELYVINKGFGLTTCEPKEENRFGEASVVMLSYNTPNSSMKQFMRYICNAYKVHSILLQCFPLKSKSAELLPGLCNCKDHNREECNCIVFWYVEEIVKMLARRMPRTLKRLSDSLCLLPSPQCLATGCHGCNQGQYVEETGESVEETGESERKKSTEPGDTEKGNKAVQDIFKHISEGSMKEDHSCICVPLSPSGYDYWTKLLIRSFEGANREYSTASLILPRLAEVSLNIGLTVWFKVDGFSSSLVARRAVKDYVVDTKGSGFAASAFLMKAKARKDNDCRVLRFRGTRSGIRTFSYIVASVNFICSIIWAIFVPLHGGKWYDKKSIPPSERRVIAIMVGVGIALFMDCKHLMYLQYSKKPSDFKELTVQVDPKDSDAKEPATINFWFRPIVKVYRVWLKPKVMVSTVIILEMVCISCLGIVLRFKCFGRWLYSALHILVWIKWGVGSYLLGEYPPEYDSQISFDNGILVYSSAFLLNSILAGVRVDWHYSLELNS